MKPKIIHTKAFSCADDHPIVYYTVDENNNAHARKFMQLFTEWASKENKTII